MRQLVFNSLAGGFVVVLVSVGMKMNNFFYPQKKANIYFSNHQSRLRVIQQETIHSNSGKAVLKKYTLNKLIISPSVSETVKLK